MIEQRGKMKVCIVKGYYVTVDDKTQSSVWCEDEENGLNTVEKTVENGENVVEWCEENVYGRLIFLKDVCYNTPLQ